MRICLIAVSLSAALSVLACGCAPFRGGGARHASQQASATRTADAGDWSDAPDDAWIEDAGHQVRGYRESERDPDRWWGRYFMSEKARSIERNLGYEHD